MRARLLDMGDVSALRSQSIYHAVTAAMTAESHPAVLLLRATSSYLSLPSSSDGEAEVDLDLCRSRGLPVLRRQSDGAAELVDGNQLRFHLALPAARGGELGLSAARAERLATLAGPALAAYRALGIAAELGDAQDIRVGDRELGTAQLAEIGDGLCFVSGMVFDRDHRLTVQALGLAGTAATTREGSLTSIWQELTEPPSLPEVAEALMAACEACFGLELVPSMPTPDELEGIYAWDSRLQGASPQTPPAAARSAAAHPGERIDG